MDHTKDTISKKLNKKEYNVKPISKHIANHIVENFHYLKRKCSIYKAFGLYHNDRTLVGVCVFSVPHSKALKLTFGTEFENEIVELSRLWVNDNVPKNGESFLIAKALKLLDKKIVFSYADKKEGHIGYIYQASNWYYTGLGGNAYEYKIKGINLTGHQISLTNSHTVSELKEYWHDSWTINKVPKKHRYLYLNCSTKQKKYLLSLFKFNVLPYPKS